ncbi:MAM domain-containing glycosylphosphatidylinositol anchor protein 1 [Protopterus annectens]|uniref:MAM domain-containing glycosylphosphatidylinositol anchor protein 1 n=1 Tax=Protopterus annectens TaxID=7888 RepID=UPI001CFB3657|nr:MAM domain-containing glycosylphosphatidylinositol anchor protein 1 [Protopterus annectens]
MTPLCILLICLLPQWSWAQGVYAPAHAQIVHSGQACVIKDDIISDGVYTIREGDTLELKCLVKGHPRPQVRWTKTAGSAADNFQETSIFNETFRIEKIQRTQGGRYYCKAENVVGRPVIKSIRVDVQYLDEPVLTVHQTVSDTRGSFYQEKTVFLRCTVNSNPPARFIWKRDTETITNNQDNGVDIYEPLYTQGETNVLKLKNLRPKDYAVYTCQVSVRNVCGIRDKSIRFQLTNTTAPANLKLSVNESLVVNPGDNVTVQCSLTGGDPIPSIFWTHTPGSMPANSRTQGGSLTIWNMQPQDSGFYNCTASNNVGNAAKKTVNIMVRSMRNATFQITPDVIKESETIEMGQDLKLSCHVDAVPQDKVVYTWYKNNKAIKASERIIITRNDPELTPVTSSLEIIELRFTDYGTYLCVASFPGSPVPDLSVEVNISGETVPPTVSVPKALSVVTIREGRSAELQCEVRGKPRPPLLWSRVDKEAPMPSGAMVIETIDEKLQLDNVSREMSGTYRCQTARYNGFNIRPREAQVQLNVQFPPLVDPAFQDIRLGLGRSVSLKCTMLKGNPEKIATATWRFNGKLLSVPPTELPNIAELKINSMAKESNGTYECSISNDVGTSSCIFYVSGKAYQPEFYYDTPNPIKSDKTFKNYSYTLQWTQMEPNAVDPVSSYRIDIRQANSRTWISKMKPVRSVGKGELIEFVVTDLKIPQSYEIKITPITIFGLGDTANRFIEYNETTGYHNPTDMTCRFESEKICGYTQDQNDHFDWTRQNNLTQNTKRTPNTGPTIDRSGIPEGYYMYIEASKPRVNGERARLISPVYNISSKPGSRSYYCVSFYYHMYGKHIGSLNVLVRGRGKRTMDTQVWTLSKNQGNRWKQANIPIIPSTPFQIVFEAIRGDGYEGDIAIDDITVTKGDCAKRPSEQNTDVVPPGDTAAERHILSSYGLLLLSIFVWLR